MRLPFVILTPACVFLGVATACRVNTTINLWQLLAVLVGALSAHISVNTFNEYLDFRSGLDARTLKTPFSGGSGALVENPRAATAVLSVASITLTVLVLIGIYFVYRYGAVVLAIGVVGIILILTYTRWLNRNPFLCLLAPGLGFGPLMVGGTHLMLTGEYPALVALVALVPFFLVNNLLLLNQFPDIAADASIGRHHFPIAYGTRNSALVYGLFSLAAAVTIVLGIYLGRLPAISGIALAPLTATVPVSITALTHGAITKKLVPYLRLNVLVTVLTPVLLGISLIL
jgi:1,4-dihydroxy-2-naphthoate octaprenyltransferase